MSLIKNSSVAVHNEWKLVKPLGKPPTKRRRQVCLVVGDKVFLFGGTSPSTVPDSPAIPDHVIDDDHQGLDAKLMDHSDLHILDCGMFLNFLTWFYLTVSRACYLNSLRPYQYILNHFRTSLFHVISNANMVAMGTLRWKQHSTTAKFCELLYQH